MKTTTHTAVTNALKQLTTVDVTQLTVKRKFKTAVNNPTRIQKWWFIVRGEEYVLQQVEGAWSSIVIQTAWKLEPAYRYDNNDTEQKLFKMDNAPTLLSNRPLLMVNLQLTM